MVLLLFYDGSKAEVQGCSDVVHEPGLLICLDYLGASLATFSDRKILGYTLAADRIEQLECDEEPRFLRLPRSRTGQRRRSRF